MLKQENTRISSVHVTENASNEKNVEPKADQSTKQDNISNFADVEVSASSYPEKLDAETDDQIIGKATNSSSVLTNTIGYQRIDTQSEFLRAADVENLSDDDEHRQNESRVFNDDLFGDFIPKHYRNKQENINSSSNLFPEGKVPQEKGVSNENTNISLKTNEDASTLTQKLSPQASKVLTENSNELKDTNNEGKDAKDIKLGDDYSDKETAKEITKPKNFVEGITERKEIFPTIPRLAPPASKINFQRSPSYIELFQGMRVVLDKHDAHYNLNVYGVKFPMSKDKSQY
ncbi:ANM_HP_G0035190.mRNA.1.CDS.1 [Saccharomyces cerevisiae]|nr:ANM_HP_G0035190.mRNA.1.CDS.1 [Saccharomyces cerevisiae]CAI7025366.1 ANM_HP_G0035190.mRNA.1.CDS.1 [Saccharomyces cerevisiae]